MAKRKLKMNKIIIFIMLLILILIGLYFICGWFSNIFRKEIGIKSYIGSSEQSVKIYDMEYNETSVIVRGTEVLSYKKDYQKEEDDSIYKRITYNNSDYLVLSDNIVSKYENSVFEKERYVRTSLTTYKSSTNSDIEGTIKKGTKLDVIGFDKILEDGQVNMYKIKYNEVESYVYSKYLVSNKEQADKNYNENGIYDFHKDRKYSYELYGGYASNLDYYPYPKVDFADNKLQDQSKTYYLVGTYYVLTEIDKYIELAKQAGATAFVVDIKDGALAYKSEIAKLYSSTSYNTAMNSIEFYKGAIDKIKNAGFYVIGRIVLFNDSTYAKDNPTDCIYTSGGTSTNWVSAYSRRAWEYNVKLAKEAIELFKFNEIQFDYVRFPEASYNWSKKNYDFKNIYKEEKAQAIQTFLYYATDEIHKMNTYLSIDVFGECAGTYVTAYGQYWPAISNIVDVVSGMPYTDHFDRKNSDYWTKPYNTMYNWGLTAAQRQKEIPTPAKVRTWITAYNTPYWKVTTVYGPNEIKAQVKGLKDAGLGSGFITWNASSNYEKYKAIASAFSEEY